jgi:hypothetical protein
MISKVSRRKMNVIELVENKGKKKHMAKEEEFIDTKQWAHIQNKMLSNGFEGVHGFNSPHVQLDDILQDEDLMRNMMLCFQENHEQISHQAKTNFPISILMQHTMCMMSFLV